MKEKYIVTAFDLLFCIVLLPLLITMVPIEKWLEEYTFFAITLLLYLYLLYFSMRKVNLPQLFMNRKYVRIIVFLLLILGITYLLSIYPYPSFSSGSSQLSPRLKEHLRSQTVWFFFFVVCGFSLSINLISELYRQILTAKETERQKDKAELAFYKAQINPHFLFNTLNTLYGLTIQKSENAEPAFAKFSGIVRYIYTHATDDFVAIRDEIEYIGHYIYLQSLRLNHHTKVIWEHSIDDDSQQIPPMILITFVENAFKYGISSSIDCTIHISLDIKDGMLCFTSKNDIMKKRSEKDSAIGIDNCRNRLELLYPERFKLYINGTDSQYELKLTIQLK